MQSLSLSVAKRDFARGLIKASWIERNPMNSTWSVYLKSSFDLSVFALAAARDSSVRQFKSLDSALSAIESIGFQINRLDALN